MLKKQLETERRNKKSLLAKNKVLEKCIDFIKIKNSQGYTNCYYNVPFVEYCDPGYDVNKTCYYIKKKLESQGLKVVIVKLGTLYLHWG